MNKKFNLYFIVCCLSIFGCLTTSCKKYEDIETSTLTGLKIQKLGYYPTYFQIEGNIFAGLGSIGFPPTGGANKKWYKYIIQEDRWQEMRDFPGEKRASRAFFAFKGKGYLIGGTDHYIDHSSGDIKKVFNDFWQYDPQTDEWAEKNIPPFTPLVLNQPAAYLNIMSTANQMFIIEGNKLWEYLPEDDRWQVVSLTVPFSIIGTSNTSMVPEVGSNTLAEVGYAFSTDNVWWEYNPMTNQWRPLVQIKAHEINYFIIKNKLYVAGISPNSNNQDTHYLWEYNLITKRQRRLFIIPALSVDGRFRPRLNMRTSDNESGFFCLHYRSTDHYMYKFTP